MIDFILATSVMTWNRTDSRWRSPLPTSDSFEISYIKASDCRLGRATVQSPTYAVIIRRVTIEQPDAYPWTDVILHHRVRTLA